MILNLSLLMLLVLLCIYDWLFRRIPNIVVISIGLIGIYSFFYRDGNLHNILIWFAYFSAGITLFYMGLFGAGDVKLILMLLLCIDSTFWLAFTLLVFIVGGIWALIYFYISQYFPSQKDFNGLPYAFPIAFSAVIFTSISTYPI